MLGKSGLLWTRHLAGAAVLGLFLGLEAYQYQLFHLFAEGFSILVAGTLFLVALNVRRWIGLGPVVFLGIVSGGVALVDFLHVIAFPSMGLFPGYGVNLAAQLWVLGRGLETVGFLAAFLLWSRRRPRVLLFFLVLLGAVLVISLVAMFTKTFPTMYVDGKGLTSIKVGLEYLYIALLTVTLVILYFQRSSMRRESALQVAVALIAAILAEVCFTLYVGPTDFYNVLGHFFKLVTYYYFYLVLIHHGLLAPYDGIFRQLQQLNANLEATVEQRTKALAESSGRFQGILEASPWPLLLISTHGKGWFGTETNRAGREFFDFEGGERRVEDLLSAAGFDGEGLAARLPGALRGGSLEADIGTGTSRRTFDIVLYPVDPRTVAAVFNDISATRRAIEGYQLQDQIFQLSGDLILVLDREGVLRLTNPAWTKILGFSPYELADRSLASVLAEEGRAEALAGFESAWNADHSGSLEVRMEGPRGGQRIVAWSLHPSPDQTLLYGVGRDVSTDRATEVMLREASKRESLAVVSGGIAHDFNNMLGGLFGFIELARLHSGSGNSAAADAALSRALGVFERAKGLTRQLLAVSKGGAGLPVVTDLEAPLRQAADFVLAGSSSRIDWSLPARLGPCKVDADQIFQAFQNLLLNAVQAMEAGGTIHIRGRNDGTQLVLEFEDEGQGVPAGLRERIFEPFFTSKATGTGLGLAVVASIAAKHGGRIELRSEPGHGACFVLTLPIAAANEMGTIAQPDPTPQGPVRVLIMEDDADVRESVAPALRSWGHVVVVTTEGRSAIVEARRAFAEGKPFHVCLLDWTVRGGDGGAPTLQELKRIDPFLRVIVTTGYAALLPQDRGYDALLAKPFRLEQLRPLLTPLPH